LNNNVFITIVVATKLFNLQLKKELGLRLKSYHNIWWTNNNLGGCLGEYVDIYGDKY
jgi:hypothetical protein